MQSLKIDPSVHLLPLSYIALPLGLVQRKILEGSQEEMMSKHSSKDSVFFNFLVSVPAFNGKEVRHRQCFFCISSLH